MSAPYTTVIGLEVHVQLATKSKLFCGCSTQFGAEPNTQTCAICIGMPGTLPVMNQEAYDLALKTAVALNCSIPEFTKWDRKQYYYPDLPKGYQISQYDLPMSAHGYLEISSDKDEFEPKRVRIIRAHLEEDAGKSVHDEVAGKADSEIDLNRTGTPLLEIVSEPDLRSSAEARAFLLELKLLLTYIDVSDCNMQESSLRVDANVNLHIDTPSGKVATPIVEIKNMNSFRAVERALDYEAERQFQVWQEKKQKLGDVPKQTRGWDDAAGVTRGQRSKEESSDYRYFPDPDLVPVVTSSERVVEVKASLGALPGDLRAKLTGEFGLSRYDADVLVNQGRELMDYYLRVVELCGDPKTACNWVTQDALRFMKEREISIAEFQSTRVSPEKLADFISQLDSGEIPRPRAREIFEEMARSIEVTVRQSLELRGVAGVHESDLVALCQQLLDANPKIVADLRKGKHEAVGALVGQARRSNPNADPRKVREIILNLVAE